MSGNADQDERAHRERIKIAFSEQQVRSAFIRKVYSILLLQLGLTFGCAIFPFFHKPTFIWLENLNLWVVGISFAVGFVSYISIICSRPIARCWPMNCILLAIFTAMVALLTSAVLVHFKLVVVVMALGLTTIIFLGLTIFAFVTSIDFTKCMVFISISMMFLIVIVIVGSIYPTRSFQVAVTYIGVVIFCLQIVFSTQLMLGGEHKYALDPEDYVVAVAYLYLDFINLFHFILILLNDD